MVVTKWRHYHPYVIGEGSISSNFLNGISMFIFTRGVMGMQDKADNHTLKSLSVVSKQFLFTSNRIQSSLAITDQTIPFLPLLFERFPNLTSILKKVNLNALLHRIFKTFPNLHFVKPLNLSHHNLSFLAKRLRAILINDEKFELFHLYQNGYY